MMIVRSARRLYVVIAFAVGCVLAAVPARAQFQPRDVSDPATGETYHVEGSIGLWFPATEMQISSTALNIVGTVIDFKKDLGLEDQKFSEFHLVVRPGRQHKLRLQFIPLGYEQSATLSRRLVFNGQAYDVNLPVNSKLDWKAWRFGYEYDFSPRIAASAGSSWTSNTPTSRASLASPIRSDFIHEQAPDPDDRRHLPGILVTQRGHHG